MKTCDDSHCLQSDSWDMGLSTYAYNATTRTMFFVYTQAQKVFSTRGSLFKVTNPAHLD